MSAIGDALLQMTDPGTVLGLAALAYYMRRIDRRHAKRFDLVRERIKRLENHGYFTDGGKPDGQKDS